MLMEEMRRRAWRRTRTPAAYLEACRSMLWKTALHLAHDMGSGPRLTSAATSSHPAAAEEDNEGEVDDQDATEEEEEEEEEEEVWRPP